MRFHGERRGRKCLDSPLFGNGEQHFLSIFPPRGAPKRPSGRVLQAAERVARREPFSFGVISMSIDRALVDAALAAVTDPNTGRPFAAAKGVKAVAVDGA